MVFKVFSSFLKKSLVNFGAQGESNCPAERRRRRTPMPIPLKKRRKCGGGFFGGGTKNGFKRSVRSNKKSLASILKYKGVTITSTILVSHVFLFVFVQCMHFPDLVVFFWGGGSEVLLSARLSSLLDLWAGQKGRKGGGGGRQYIISRTTRMNRNSKKTDGHSSGKI